MGDAPLQGQGGGEGEVGPHTAQSAPASAGAGGTSASAPGAIVIDDANLQGSASGAGDGATDSSSSDREQSGKKRKGTGKSKTKGSVRKKKARARQSEASAVSAIFCCALLNAYARLLAPQRAIKANIDKTLSGRTILMTTWKQSKVASKTCDPPCWSTCPTETLMKKTSTDTWGGTQFLCRAPALARHRPKTKCTELLARISTSTNPIP